MRGDDKLTILRFLNRRLREDGRRQTYDSSFLKSRERWRRGDDNLGFFDSSFLEFQETRDLRVEI